METINDRIEILINKCFDGNKAAFAKSIGLPPTGMSNYLGKQRRSKPSVDMIVKIINTLNVDADWLLMGKGETDFNNADVSGHHNQLNKEGAHDNINIAGGDLVLEEKVKHLEEIIKSQEAIISEKDERIKDLKDLIEILRTKN
jgi:hypothetical protein